eukprot:5715741-Prymnesium_polylepis.1
MPSRVIRLPSRPRPYRARFRSQHFVPPNAEPRPRYVGTGHGMPSAQLLELAGPLPAPGTSGV